MPKAPKAKVGENKKVIHPNSRKALLLARKAQHETRVSQSKTQTSVKLDLQATKLLWFQSNLDQNKDKFTKKDLSDLVNSYMKRFEAELDQIGIVRNVGNRLGQQHVSRENAIQMTLERENRQLEEGVFEVPDILNVKNLENFRKWSGETKTLSNIKLKKISKKILESVDESDMITENETTE